MKYNNKMNDKIRDRMTKSQDGIVSANKMKKARSSMRSAAFNIGKIVNKTSEADKAQEKVALKNGDYTDGKETKQPVKDNSIKVFNKGNVSYIKYKGNNVPVSNLFALSKTDSDINNFVKNTMKQKTTQQFNGTFNEFLAKQYS